MYFEFDDVRRIHQPYTDNMFRSKLIANKMWLQLDIESISRKHKDTNIKPLRDNI